MSTALDERVIWHDVECGGYDADLPLWLELADAAGGPVVDLGAGTGRVALRLAARHLDVTAIDIDDALLAALRRKARRADLRVETLCADARDFTVARPAALVVIPMQTLQLLDGPTERARCYAAVRRALLPGGRLAAALATELDPFAPGDDFDAPLPDVREIGDTVYASRPVALRDAGRRVVLERVREVVGPTGELRRSDDAIALDRITAADVAAEATAYGFAVEPEREVAATLEHVGSEVVMLRAV